MRRYRTARTRQARTYSIPYLLSRQPKTLQKDRNYPLMLAHLRTSDRLRRLRISRRCYSLLDRATIGPENLRDFYRTYRLPADPFFPLYFSIKRNYLAERARIKEERRRYILASMRALPPPVLATIKYLGQLERHYNAARRYPIWEQHLFPRSKKRADEYSRYTPDRWRALFGEHLSLLQQRYTALSTARAGLLADRLNACFVLGLPLKTVPPTWPSRTEVNRTYRKLSLLHHPDRGGDPATFVAIKRARDTLLGETHHQAK
jgi:hypothetical protein